MTEELSQKKTGVLKNFKKWRLIVAGVVLLAVLGGAFLLWPEKGTDGKFTVLIPAFDVPDGAKNVCTEMISELTEKFSDNEQVELLVVNKVLTGEGGSQTAREFGSRRRAELIVWAKVDSDDDQTLLIQVENLGRWAEESGSVESEPGSTWGGWETLVFKMPFDGEVDQMTAYLTGVVAYAQGDYATALVFFDQAVESKGEVQVVVPEEIAAFQLARHLAQTDSEKIIADYTRMIAVQPELASLYFHRGRAYVSLEKYDQAIEDYTEAIKLEPEDRDAIYNRGLVYKELEEYQQARTDFNKVIELDDSYLPAYFERGVIRIEEGKYMLAFEDLDHYIENEKGNALAYFHRGRAYAIKNAHLGAIEDFNKAIEIDPQLNDAYYERGVSYFNREIYEKAISDFDYFIVKSSEHAMAYFYRGITHQFLAEYDQAILDLDHSIELDPEYADAYYYRGFAHESLEHFELAISDFSQVLELTPRGYASGERFILSVVQFIWHLTIL
jgi:tetratricopeptide (TPR) repeat protein